MQMPETALLRLRSSAGRQGELVALGIRLGVVQPKLSGQLGADARKLSRAQQRQQLAAIDHAVLLAAGQLLVDQPLVALGERVAAEARLPCRRLGLGHELAIEPGDALGTDFAARVARSREPGLS